MAPVAKIWAMQVTLLHATGRNFRSRAYVGTKYCRSGFCESEWLQYKYPWRWWHSGGEPGGFGLLQSLSLYSRGTSWSVSLLQSGILTIRIFAYVHRIHAPRLVSFQPAVFRLHSRARHRNFYSQNQPCIVGLLTRYEKILGCDTVWFLYSLRFLAPLSLYSIFYFSFHRNMRKSLMVFRGYQNFFVGRYWLMENLWFRNIAVFLNYY